MHKVQMSTGLQVFGCRFGLSWGVGRYIFQVLAVGRGYDVSARLGQRHLSVGSTWAQRLQINVGASISYIMVSYS